MESSTLKSRHFFFVGVFGLVSLMFLCLLPQVAFASSLYGGVVESILPTKARETWDHIKWKYYLSREVEENGKNVELDWTSVGSLWSTLHQRYQPIYIYFAVYATLVVGYFVTGLIFWAIEHSGVWQKYKIQPKQRTTPSQYWMAVKNFLFNYTIVIIPITITAFPMAKALGISYEGPFPSLSEVVIQNIIFLFLEDFFEYWGHRLLHIGPLYTYIHKVHHAFQAPFGFTAAYAHPIETIWLGLATFLPPFIIRPHLFTFYLWIHLRQYDSVVTHCGFEIPFNVFDYLAPFYGGTKFHDYHHTSFYYNYASRFTWTDKLFGTYRDPDEKKKKTT